MIEPMILGRLNHRSGSASRRSELAELVSVHFCRLDKPVV
jgi:hypothetical protein